MISTQCELVRVEIPTGKASHNRSDGSLEPKLTKTSEKHSDIVDLSNGGLWQQQQQNKTTTTKQQQQQQQQQQQVHILTDIKVRWCFTISLHPWWGDDGFLCMSGSLLLQLVQVTLRLLTDYNMLHDLFPRNQNYSTLWLWLFIANAILHDSNLRVWYFLYVKTTILW